MMINETWGKKKIKIKKNVTGTPKRPAGLHTRNRLDKTDHALLETKTRRRKDLATLMGSLIDEVVKVRGSNSYDSCCSSPYSKPHRWIIWPPWWIIWHSWAILVDGFSVILWFVKHLNSCPATISTFLLFPLGHSVRWKARYSVMRP